MLFCPSCSSSCCTSLSRGKVRGRGLWKHSVSQSITHFVIRITLTIMINYFCCVINIASSDSTLMSLKLRPLVNPRAPVAPCDQGVCHVIHLSVTGNTVHTSSTQTSFLEIRRTFLDCGVFLRRHHRSAVCVCVSTVLITVLKYFFFGGL